MSPTPQPTAPWSPPAPAAERYPILVVGSRDDTFLVDDLPGEVVTIDREALARAWTAHRTGRHQITTVLPVPDMVDLPRGVRQRLRRELSGSAGWAGWPATCATRRTRSGWVRRFGEPSRTRYAAARLAECLTTSYTTAGATRPLYAEFLREAATAVAVPGLVEAAAAHEEQAVALVRKSLRS